MRQAMLMLGMLAVLLTGCGAAPQVSDETDTGADAVELGSQDGTAPAAAGGGGAGSSPDEDPDAPASGSSGGEDVETVQAGGAGEVDVRVVDGGRLELVEVRAAPEWSHRVDEHEREEIELGFRHDSGRTLEAEIELVGGRLEVETR